MAEGSGGEAAVVLFTDLTDAASRVTQHVRELFSPPGATVTWLGPSGLLSDALAGSVLRCESPEEGKFAVVVPPRIRSAAAPVKCINGAVSVRVSRDGSLASARYEDLRTLHHIVQSITPGVVTMGGSSGPLAGSVKLLASGQPAAIVVSTEPTQATRPLFTVTDSISGEVIGESADFGSLLSLLTVLNTVGPEFVVGR